MLEDGTDLRRPYPKLATGVVHSRSENQLFLQTQPTLVLGMCGGPVCLDMGTGTVIYSKLHDSSPSVNRDSYDTNDSAAGMLVQEF